VEPVEEEEEINVVDEYGLDSSGSDMNQQGLLATP
jgi:hypothetical protein